MEIKNLEDLKSNDYKIRKGVKSLLDRASAEHSLRSEVVRVTENVIDVLYSYKKEGTAFSDAFNLICSRNLTYFEKIVSDYSVWLNDLNDLSISVDTKNLINYVQKNYLTLPDVDNIEIGQIHPNVDVDIINRIDDLCKMYSITKLQRHKVIEYIFSKDDFDDLKKGIRQILQEKFLYVRDGLDKYEEFFNNKNDDFLTSNFKIISRLKSEGILNKTFSKVLEYVINLLSLLKKRDKNEHFYELIEKINSFIDSYEQRFIEYDLANENIIKEIRKLLNELK